MRPQKGNEGCSWYTHSVTHIPTDITQRGRPFRTQRSELKFQETGRREAEMFRLTAHFGLSSPGIIVCFLHFLLPGAGSEVWSAPRSGHKWQEGRAGGGGWAMWTPDPINGSSPI